VNSMCNNSYGSCPTRDQKITPKNDFFLSI
jgi:hypothetical protein